MYRHIISLLKCCMVRIGIPLALLCAALSASLPAYAAGAPPNHTNHTAPTPQLSPHPHSPVSQPSKCRTSTQPCPKIDGSGQIVVTEFTGQYTYGRPAVMFCNNQYYIAWGSADPNQAQLYIAQGASAGAVGTPVPIQDWVLANTGPTLACWNSQLWVAFTGTNNILYAGYFNESNYLQSHHPVKDGTTMETSDYSPSLSTGYDTQLTIAWTGQDNGGNGSLNLERTSDGVNWSFHKIWRNQGGSNPNETATSGPGLAYYCSPPGYTCEMYIAWVGNDSNHSLNIGDFLFGSNIFAYVQNISKQMNPPNPGPPNGDVRSWPGDDVALVPLQSNSLFLLYIDGPGYVTDVFTNYAYDTQGSWQSDIESYSADRGASGAVDPQTSTIWVVWDDGSPDHLDEGYYVP